MLTRSPSQRQITSVWIEDPANRGAMSYKLTALGLLLTASLLLISPPFANAGGEHGQGGGGGGAAPPQMQRASAPPQQRMAPQQMQRAFPPPQQRMAPQQMQRSFAPPQQRMAPQQMQRSFAPSQQRMSSTRQQRMSSSASQSRIQARGSNRTSVSNTRARNISARQVNSTGKNSVARQSEKNFGNVTRARQIAQRDQRASGARSSTKSVERQSEKNGGSVTRARQIAQRDQRTARAQSSAKLASARSLSANKGKPSANGRMLASVAGIKQTRGAVSRPSSFANPRKALQVRSGSKPQITSARPQKLAYRRGAGNIPRAGRAGRGRAGIIDPGGYIRTAEKGTARLERNHIQQQLAALPNYESNFSNNNRLRISDHSRWSSHWNPGPGSAVLGYYPGYSWNGTNYPFSYYAPSGYCPTPYLFLSNYGTFWQPGVGYADSLPYGYNQPMSIAIDEVVPEYDAYGNIIGYHDETFYYNAAWDPNAQAYGYYDYRGGFHWVTFPWLNTWNNQNSFGRDIREY